MIPLSGVPPLHSSDFRTVYAPLPQQSPIDLDASTPIEHKFDSKSHKLKWKNEIKGKCKDVEVGTPNAPRTNREFEFEKGSGRLSIVYPGEKSPVDFELAKLHFHTETEHVTRHSKAKFELHIVHKTKEKDPFVGGKREIYAVIAVFVEEKSGIDRNDKFSELMKSLNESFTSMKNIEIPQSQQCSITIDPNHLLPFDPAKSKLTDQRFWRYEGSLTTKVDAPNDGYVSWFVLEKPQYLTPEQIADWTQNPHEDKDPQPLNRRYVFFNPGAPGT